jgi:hypothetical protein
MKPQEEERVEQLLRRCLAPVRTDGQDELRRDLWPEFLRRMETRAARVPWFDWALLAAVVVWLAFFREALPMFLYHL